jgi:hypothetical protein
MKTRVLLILAAFLMSVGSVFSQTEYFYQLNSSFHANQSGAPDLVQIPNDQGVSGSFVIRTIPSTTCGATGNAPGYFFADDSGLQFNDPVGFIDQAYSLALNFQMDEFISPPAWVRLLSFTHIDDVGLYIQLTDPPNHGTLEFWPYGTVGQQNFFSPLDFYQMILIRNSAGLITVYINGQQFAQYDDGTSQAYVPKDPSNFIVFFRDHPSVLAGEASPGFVSSIRITNDVWTETKVQELWTSFCSSLMGVEKQKPHEISLFPNPTEDLLNINRNNPEKISFSVYDLTGRKELSGNLSAMRTGIDLHFLVPGIYWVCLYEPQGPSYFKVIKR